MSTNTTNTPNATNSKTFEHTVAHLEYAIEYVFQDKQLIKEALTHPSLKQHNPLIHNYERLEILGDSILGFLITEMLFYSQMQYKEGDIAKIKAHGVSREVIVQVANNISLADYIIMSPGEEKSSGRSNSNNIADSMEAVIAAIYLDGGIAPIQAIVQRLWAKYIHNIDFDQVNPKSALQELIQNKHSQGFHPPQYQLISTTGSAHSPLFTIQVSSGPYNQVASGSSRKDAEKNAAQLLIQQLKSLT